MIFYDLLNVLILSSSIKLSEIVHKRPHASWKLKDSVDKLTKRNFSCTERIGNDFYEHLSMNKHAHTVSVNYLVSVVFP